MSLHELLADLRGDAGFMANVMTWQTLPARPAQFAPMPDALHPRLRQALAARGITRLYSHQADAIDTALAGQDVVVVTPTASGKTLCYNGPVLNSLLRDPDGRALYLFPTKALAQDQLAELNGLLAAIDATGVGDEPLDLPQVATYDGDTPSAARSQVRRGSRLILSNPDMLHAGILPYHTNWNAFFAGLRYVVIDEMHVYRGVFGSHMANVLRRLRRICAFYGSSPRFVLASATIANPQELAVQLIERPVTLVERNGAPRGERHVLLYNPPLYDAERGLRRSSVLETQEIAARCVLADAQTIVFGRARQTTEILLTYLRDRLRRVPNRRDSAATDDPRTVWADADDLAAGVRGYRGGYLPLERRAIEAGLRSGAVRAVVATNALELGIDIGRLQAAVLCGYPGSIAGTWQQIGRAGRTTEAALAVLVATGGVLDQYVAQHPEFIFDQSPEHARINPDNLMLLVDQIRCAAFELPFAQDEAFGACTVTDAVLALLAEQGDVLAAGPRLVWSGHGYPARQVSLRSAGSETVAIEAEFDGGRTVIGQVDRGSATLLAHDGAVYIHEGASYQVERLDLEQNLATVVPANVDFYTEVTSETQVETLAVAEECAVNDAHVAHGELLISSQAVGYRRIKRFTHETLGVFPLSYPPQQLETNGYWISVLPAAQLKLAAAGQWFDSVNDYGPNWQEVRAQVRARDGYRCAQCGAPEPPGRQHDVHHLVPFRTFGYVAGVNENYRLANRPENLMLLCRACHHRLESGVRVRSGLDGLAYALANLAPLHLMCDVSDLGLTVMRGDPMRAGQSEASPEHAGASDAQLPTVYIYERIAAGMGFSARLFELHTQLLDAAQTLVARCPCAHGCPACVGPVLDNDLARLETKQLTASLLQVLRTGTVDAPPSSDEVKFW
ncbi:MAG: DEAD/DEAH box helicase [Caldilineaceae bacterium]|nr:DEAD/DEAH box helicase [Caldilineaceae bacterium]